MTIRFHPGDTVFNADGRPGVIIGRDPRTAELIVERNGPNYDKARTRGFINGLQSEQREKFNRVMAEVRSTPDQNDRVNKLQSRIEELREDPRNHVVTRYLEGEMAHIMNSERIQPKVFKMEESDV